MMGVVYWLVLLLSVLSFGIRMAFRPLISGQFVSVCGYEPFQEILKSLFIDTIIIFRRHSV